jgi:hypothetical protein
MALWGKTDAAASAPKFTGLASNGAIANAIFGGVTTGVFGVDAAESQYARATDNKPVAQGWVLQQYGTGPVTALAISAGGASYVNNEVVTFSNGTTNATATITTNATGGVTALTITAGGSGFANSGHIVIQVANSTAASNSTNGNTSGGSSLAVTITLGGRAGRVNRETLVALTAYPNNDASDDGQFPE